MTTNAVRSCPLCGSSSGDLAFPYATRFNGVDFKYLRCIGCSSVFVDPVPDDQTFALMYAKDIYHDCHYDGVDETAYHESAHLLREYHADAETVLDYGCGIGAFLKALGGEGFKPFGVEFDEDAAKLASKNANCTVLSVSAFHKLPPPPQFDVIHLGDVLEHLPEPDITLRELLAYLKPGGILFIEGPLEINPSPVYWAANLFGWIKRQLKPATISGHAPTHLFRTGEKQQKDFFVRVVPNIEITFWQVYEKGWPYIRGGVVKRFIARTAILLGGRKINTVTFGNRFKVLLKISNVQVQSKLDG